MKPARLTRLLLVSIATCSLFSARTATAAPFGIPPLAEDQLLAKIAPDECLWYVSWAGSATPQADSKNHLEALLAEKEVQHLVQVIENAIVQAIDQEAGGNDEQRAAAKEAMKLAKSMIHRPTAIYITNAKPGPRGTVSVQGGLVLHAGDDIDTIKAAIRKLHNDTPLKAVLKDAEIDGTTWTQFPGDGPVPQITLGFKGRYLVVGVGTGEAEAILKRATTPAPAWLAKVKSDLAVERPSITSYINLAMIRELALSMQGEFAEPAKWLGLDKLTALATVVGLDGPDTLSRTLIGIDGEPTGLFALAGDKPLELADLAMIPKDSTFAMAVRMDAKRFVLEALELLGRFDKRAQEQVLDGLDEAQGALGFSLVDDILGSLGDVWTVYNSPDDGGFLLSGFTGTVSVRDKEKLAGALDKLLLMAKAQGVLGPITGRDRRPIAIRSMEYKDQRILYLVASDRVFPPIFAPSLCLTDKHLIVSAFPQHIKTFLDRDPNSGSLADQPAIADTFKAGAPFKFVYHNTPFIVESFYPLAKFGAAAASRELAREGVDVDISALPSLPTIAKHLVPGTIAVRKTSAGLIAESRNSIPGDWGVAAMGPIMLGVAIPAVGSARAVARDTASMNNLRQVALAMHTHHSEHGKFPPRAIQDKDGKPLLSWRVKILPYIEGNSLYEEFKLDEPWDSEHNKKLIARMPQVYRSPTSRAAPGSTTYVVPTGKGAAFEGNDGLSIATIRDGTSNTVMAIEVNDTGAVPWTKPDDLDLDAEGWQRKLFGPRGSTNAVFCDGAVHRIAQGLDADVLKAIFTRAGGEVVGARDLFPREFGHADEHDHAHDHADAVESGRDDRRGDEKKSDKPQTEEESENPFNDAKAPDEVKDTTEDTENPFG